MDVDGNRSVAYGRSFGATVVKRPGICYFDEWLGKMGRKGASDPALMPEAQSLNRKTSHMWRVAGAAGLRC